MKQSLHVLSLTVTLLFFCSMKISAQDSSVTSQAIYFPDKLVNKINVKSGSIDQRLTRQTEKYLLHFSKEELRLKRKLSLIDSVAAKRIFGDAVSQYSRLQQTINNASGNIPGLSGKYLPRLDSLQTALMFINRFGSSTDKSTVQSADVRKALSNVHQLQERFCQVDNITQFMKQRKKYLRDQLHLMD